MASEYGAVVWATPTWEPSVDSVHVLHMRLLFDSLHVLISWLSATVTMASKYSKHQLCCKAFQVNCTTTI